VIAGVVVGAVIGQLVIELAVVAVVGDRMLSALHVAAGVYDVEVADLALDRQRGLSPVVAGKLRPEMHELEIAYRRVVAEGPLALDGLPLEGRRDGPVVSQIEPELCATTVGIHGVVVVPAPGRVGDRARSDRRRRHA